MYYSTNETIIDIDVSDKTYSFLGGETKKLSIQIIKRV